MAKPKVNPYQQPGSHMWKLLFAEREYVPLPKSWHAWHFAVASVPALVAWMYFSRVRRQMNEVRVGKEKVKSVLMAPDVGATAASDAETRMLATQVMELKQSLKAVEERLEALSKQTKDSHD